MEKVFGESISLQMKDVCIVSKVMQKNNYSNYYFDVIFGNFIFFPVILPMDIAFFVAFVIMWILGIYVARKKLFIYYL